MISPVEADDYIVFSDNMAKTQASFAKFSKHDAEIYPEFDRYLQEATAIVRKLLFETPIDPARRDWRSFKDTARRSCGATARSAESSTASSI